MKLALRGKEADKLPPPVKRRLLHTRHAGNPFRQAAVCFLKHFLYSAGA